MPDPASRMKIALPARSSTHEVLPPPMLQMYDGIRSMYRSTASGLVRSMPTAPIKASLIFPRISASVIGLGIPPRAPQNFTFMQSVSLAQHRKLDLYPVKQILFKTIVTVYHNISTALCYLPPCGHHEFFRNKFCTK